MKNFLVILDKVFFKLVGLFFGIAGSLFIVRNNNLELLLSNLHGLAILVIFLFIALFSIITSIKEIVSYLRFEKISRGS
ncbi:MAG: hypothetical protein ACN4E2_00855 [Nitrospinota bacterium]